MLSHFSHVQLFATPQTVAHQALLSTGFSWQEYWRGLPLPPGDLSDAEIEILAVCISCVAGRSLPTEPPGSPLNIMLAPKKYILVAMHCQLLLLILK